jgi:hypothetical protein
MAVAFRFTFNGDKVNAKIATMVTRQVPFAAAKSLTLTSKTLVEQNKRDAPKIFSNPTAWTRNAFFFIPARKNNPRTIIKRKDRASGTASNAVPSKQHYLEVQQQGGARKPKAFEGAIRIRGKGAGKFRYATPTRDARLNASGNMTRNSINKIIGGLGNKGGKFFVPEPSHPLAIKGGDGVFERMARNKVRKRLHLFNTMPSYRPRFRFYARMEKYGKQAFPRIFRRELRNAIRSSGFRG